MEIQWFVGFVGLTMAESALKAVADLRDDRQKGEKYMELLENILGMGDVEQIITCVDHLTSDEAGRRCLSFSCQKNHTIISGASSDIAQGHESFSSLCKENAYWGEI
jgi:hypothetical protein